MDQTTEGDEFIFLDQELTYIEQSIQKLKTIDQKWQLREVRAPHAEIKDLDAHRFEQEIYIIRQMGRNRRACTPRCARIF